MDFIEWLRQKLAGRAVGDGVREALRDSMQEFFG